MFAAAGHPVYQDTGGLTSPLFKGRVASIHKLTDLKPGALKPGAFNQYKRSAGSP